MKVVAYITNIISSFSNKIDLYKTPITFKFKSEKHFHTIFGKILTYLVYILLISYIVVLVKEMIYRTNNNINNYTFINERKEYDSELNTINLNDSPIIFSFYMIQHKVQDVLLVNLKVDGQPPLQLRKCTDMEIYIIKQCLII